jgi:hypothetical protein
MVERGQSRFVHHSGSKKALNLGCLPPSPARA